MRKTRSGWFAFIALVWFATPALGQAPSQGMARLGTVEFKVECSPAAQSQFNTAMALYHSYAWPQSVAAFKAVAVTDPSCGMAHWGHAASLLGNPFVWPTGLTSQLLDDVIALLDAAKSAGLKSQREHDYVAAVGIFVRDHAAKPHAQRMQAYDDAMARLMARYPEDTEAKVLSAVITSANFVPADKTYTNQMRAAAILEPLFAAKPNHPGVAHYLIHSYDYPPIAHMGLGAAQAYAGIAPDAAHALHMPSHIFTRVGYWKESVAANQESSRVAGGATFDGHHASDYMVYAHLQLAQDRAARKAMASSLGLKAIDNFAAAYAYAAMPARLALEYGDWAAAAVLPLSPGADVYPWTKYPHAEAVNAFARGVGAARAGNAAGASEQKIRLAALRDAAASMGLSFWVEQIDIQRAVVDGLGLCAEGRRAECIDALKAAAVREDAIEKHVVTPGPVVPARELLAEMLLAQDKNADALREYEAVMKKEPNRYRAIAGAMAAAGKAGDPTKARALAAELQKLGGDADTQRATLVEAKRIAGK